LPHHNLVYPQVFQSLILEFLTLASDLLISVTHLTPLSIPNPPPNQIDLYAQQAGNLKLVGYYHADAKFASTPELNPIGKRVSDRIHDKEGAGVALVVDNKKLAAFVQGTGGEPGCMLESFTRDGGRGWKKGGNVSSSWQSVREAFLKLHGAHKHRQLSDFDEHLDDIAKDYLNKWLNTELSL
jgi:hypothetical protein